jgi:hypothetical protein
MAAFTRNSQDMNTKFETELPEALTKALQNPAPRRKFKPLKHCEDKQHCTNYVTKRKKKTGVLRIGGAIHLLPLHPYFTFHHTHTLTQVITVQQHGTLGYIL